MRVDKNWKPATTRYLYISVSLCENMAPSSCIYCLNNQCLDWSNVSVIDEQLSPTLLLVIYKNKTIDT